MRKFKKSQANEIDKKIEDETKKRVKRCIPLAIELIKLLAEKELVLGEADLVANAEVYDEVAKEMLQKMLDACIPYSDRNFIFQIAMQPIEMSQEKVLRNLERSYEIARDKIWGKNFFDLTLEDIDKALKA